MITDAFEDVDTFKEFKRQVESYFPNYMVDYSPENNRVFVFKDEEPFCIAKIFLERHGKYMVFDVNIPDVLLEMIADYSAEF